MKRKKNEVIYLEKIDLNEISPEEEKFSPNRLIEQEEVQVILLAFAPG